MIRLHQFKPNKKTRNFSPYCLKLETYLRMAQFPYEPVNDNDPRKAPKKKLPWIEDDGQIVADSGIIVDYLKKKYGDKVDAWLGAAERAQAHALRRMMEEHLNFVLAYSRWVEGWDTVRDFFFRGAPAPVRLLVAPIIRKDMIKTLYRQGMGRHTPGEVYEAGKADLTALSEVLGQKPFFLGDRPASIDATAYGFLNNILNDVVDSPLKKHAASLPNLAAFCDRMKEKYFKTA